MQAMRVLFKKLEDWFTLKKRRRITLATIAAIAALASVIPSINSYSNYSYKPPAGSLAWFASSSLGAHEVDPQYSQACVTHDHYYPIGMTVDQSGWPLSFEYDIFTAHFDCAGAFYPIPFIIDFSLFLVTYVVLLVAVPRIITKLRQNKHITRKRIIFVAATSVVSIFITYGTAHLIRISEPDAQVPPVLSAVITSDYEIPISFPLCPSSNTTVEDKVCHGPELCALTGISEPSDPRDVIQGWPLPYIYSSLDPCFGETIYPLIFLVDAIVYVATFAAVASIVGHIRLQRPLKEEC